jgi:S-adenosylmethionine-diacylglycerol 3-amino-3-carboxypropyl transferase
VRRLSGWEDFYRFFGEANDPANVEAFDEQLAGQLPPDARAYWEKRGLNGKRRIAAFAANIYRSGVLGRFIRAGQWAARLYGIDLRALFHCSDIDGQRAFFDQHISPLLSKGFVRRFTKSRLSLFGLGIPPAQYEALAEGRDMGHVLHERLERLTCGFPLRENYFAWQAFGSGYAPEGEGPLPPYLQKQNFAALRLNIERLSVQQVNLVHYLEQAPQGSVDRVVLLDAQDWMSDAQLNALWRAIEHATPLGARVIFRTAGRQTILPGRVANEVLAKWAYLAEASALGHAQDRSSIYGGFHVYERQA